MHEVSEGTEDLGEVRIHFVGELNCKMASRMLLVVIHDRIHIREASEGLNTMFLHKVNTTFHDGIAFVLC